MSQKCEALIGTKSKKCVLPATKFIKEEFLSGAIEKIGYCAHHYREEKNNISGPFTMPPAKKSASSKSN